MERELPDSRRASASSAGVGLAGGAESAEARDARRLGVVALRLRADHGLVDAAGPALEDVAVPVDEEVVADVVPAVRVAVVAADAAHDRGESAGV